jgi:hypothetical protein
MVFCDLIPCSLIYEVLTLIRKVLPIFSWWKICLPWRCKQQVHPRCLWLSTRLHGITYLNTVILLFTAMRIPSLIISTNDWFLFVHPLEELAMWCFCLLPHHFCLQLLVQYVLNYLPCLEGPSWACALPWWQGTNTQKLKWRKWFPLSMRYKTVKVHWHARCTEGILYLLPSFILGPLACLTSELIWFCGSYRVCRTPWTGDPGWSACRKDATYTRQHEHRRNTNTHLCLEWESDPSSLCLSGRRHFMP